MLMPHRDANITGDRYYTAQKAATNWQRREKDTIFPTHLSQFIIMGPTDTGISNRAHLIVTQQAKLAG